MQLDYSKWNVGQAKEAIQNLTNALKEVEVKVQETLERNRSVFCKEDPEVAQLVNTLHPELNFKIVMDVLGPKQEGVMWVALAKIETKTGIEGIAKKLVESGLLREEYWYMDPTGIHGDTEIGDEDDLNSFKEIEDGVETWACPVRGVIIPKDEFDGGLYSILYTTDIYHQIYQRMMKGVDELKLVP